MPNIRQRIAHYARQATKRLVPYKHELTAIARQLGCEDRPFQCWIEVNNLRHRVLKLDKLCEEVVALRSTIGDYKRDREAINEAVSVARSRWRAMGFADRTPPAGADLLVWLMSQLEAAEARLETERSTLNAFQASALDLLNTNERLRERIKALEGAPSAGTESGNVAA